MSRLKIPGRMAPLAGRLRAVHGLRIFRFTMILLWAVTLATLLTRYSAYTRHHYDPGLAGSAGRVMDTTALADIEHTASIFATSPISSPYENQFGELGRRAQQLHAWIGQYGKSCNSDERARLLAAIEGASQALFPFLRNPPRNPQSRTPLTDLLGSFKTGTRGVVIPAGSKTLRYACHLIASLREILQTDLPIEIAYAGDGDLAPADRALLSGRFGSDVKFLDVLSVFDDATLSLQKGKWAIKPFAALASSFQEVILLDADAVLLQQPEAFLSQGAYTTTGAYLFRDRLLWKGFFRERHAWWHSQIRQPSAALNRSLVWTEGYAEEGDSGAVVLDKGRLEVAVGLLHVCWQNTVDVRKEVTYRLTHGDKESWWLGLELTGSPYAFEEHYAAIIGWEKEESRNDDGEAEVCSFAIAHVDEEGRLLWYNGGLLRDKARDSETFMVPTHWMVDGTWEKGPSKEVPSCMAGRNSQVLDNGERGILTRAVELATRVDADFGFG